VWTETIQPTGNAVVAIARSSLKGPKQEGNNVKRFHLSLMVVALLVFIATVSFTSQGSAQDTDGERISALETRVAALETALAETADAGSEETGNADSTPSPEATEQASETVEGSRKNPAKIKQQVELDGVLVTVYSVVFRDDLVETNAPGAGNRYVAIDVRIENQTNGSYDYSAYGLNLKDPEEGYEFDSDFITAFAETPLSTGSLESGDFVRGTVVFQVPDDLSKVLVVFHLDQYGFDSTAAYWLATIRE
jgi:hypothetical protein